MRTTHHIAVLALALATGAGCAGEEVDTQAAAAEAPAAVAAEAAAPALTDPEIAHIAVTANAIDVAMAGLAESRATNPEVAAFAQTMITDHTAVNERAAALAQRLGVTPADNATSQSLQAGADEARAKLEGLSGAAFDSAYMEREVGFHQAVLDALDKTLVPATANAELRALLEEVRPVIVAHLDHARALQSSLETDR